MTTIPLDGLIEALFRSALAESGARRAYLGLVDGEREGRWFAAETNAEGPGRPRLEARPAPPLPSDHVLYPVASQVRLSGEPAAVSGPTTSALCLPLVSHARVIALLGLEADGEWAQRLSTERLASLEALSEHAALALEQALRLAELERELADLRASSRLLSAIIDNSSAVVYAKDLEGGCLMVNRRFEELFHVDRALAVGRTDYDLFPKERADAFREVDRQVVLTRSAVQAEELVPMDDGLHAYDSSKFPLLNERGEIYAVCGISVDVTERKRAEEQLLRERRLFTGGPCVVFRWVAAAGWPVEYVSPNVIDVFGRSADDFISGRVPYASVVHPEDLERVAAEVTAHSAAGEASFEQEYRIVLPDGQIRWLYDRTVVARAKDGGVTHYEGYVLDATERKRAEAEREARLAAEAANRAKSEFLANVSHELRSPLNVVLGFTRLMAWRTDLPRDAREDLGVVLRSGEHLHTVIDQILDLAKIEAGRAAVVERAFDLHRLLGDLEDMFALGASEKKLELEFRRGPGVPRFVITDEVKLRQVLINVLSNAIKFTQTGAVSLQVGADEATGRLDFTVTDTGPGISAEELAGLGRAFAQAEAGRRSLEGTGLGLTISRSFVKLMGGELRIESRLGLGTTVSFDIAVRPVDALEESPLLEDASGRRVIGLEPGQPVHRVLIADDRADARALLVRLLGPVGFEVREAANGQEAVDVWSEWRPKLVWMDLRMPVLDGFEATRLIRAAEQTRQTVIIALTASSVEAERAQVLEAGFDDFLRKPFHEGELFGLMGKYLGARFEYAQATPPLRMPPARLPPPSSIPGELLGRLRRALIELEPEAINEAIESIRAHDEEWAAGVRTLASSYAYEDILSLLRGDAKSPHPEQSP